MTTSHVIAVSLLYRLEMHLSTLAARQLRLAECVEVVVDREGLNLADWVHLGETLRQFATEVAMARTGVAEVRHTLRRYL